MVVLETALMCRNVNGMSAGDRASRRQLILKYYRKTRLLMLNLQLLGKFEIISKIKKEYIVLFHLYTYMD